MHIGSEPLISIHDMSAEQTMHLRTILVYWLNHKPEDETTYDKAQTRVATDLVDLINIQLKK